MGTSKFINMLFGKRMDPIYESALKGVDHVIACYKGDVETLKKNHKWELVFPDNPNTSPKVMKLNEPNQKPRFMINLPKNSLQYSHRFKDICKFVEVWDGEFYEKTTGKKYVKGDRFKISPKETFIPYTKDSECFVHVVMDDCSKSLSILDIQCKL